MGLYTAVLRARMFGQQCVNVMHFDENEVPVGDDRAAVLAAHLRDNFLQQVKTRTVNQCVWEAIDIYQTNNPGHTKVGILVSIAGLVTNTSSNTVPFACTLLRFRTSTSGPKGRGRIYLPGTPTVDFLAGAPTSNTITSWAGILNTIGPMYVGPGPSSGFWLSIVPKNDPNTIRHVHAIELAGRMGVQRRRNLGVGV